MRKVLLIRRVSVQSLKMFPQTRSSQLLNRNKRHVLDLEMTERTCAHEMSKFTFEHLGDPGSGRYLVDRIGFCGRRLGQKSKKLRHRRALPSFGKQFKSVVRRGRSE